MKLSCSMIDYIEVICVVVENNADVLSFHVFEVFLHLLVLVFSWTFSLLPIPSVAHEFFLLLGLSCSLLKHVAV